ncbi:gliding motility protein GldN [Persicitalea sp.]|uniref:type IX secretion system ring protein PorN/GldN n=1 Tax=Persicitalea sp. TaxID=3100273 RepID=UPI003593B9F2
MRINGKVVALSIVSMALGATAVQAQERDETKMNQLSARPIDDQDILMKKTLWRRVDLNEKQNLPMFSKNNEITRYLLEAAKAGLLDAYVNDSCVTKLTPEELHKKLLIPNQVAGLSAEEIAAGFGQPAANDGGWGDAPKKEEVKKEAVADDGWGTPVKDTKKTAVVEDDGWGTPVKKSTPKKGAKKGAAPTEAPKDTVVVPIDPFDQQLAVITTEEEFFPDQLSLLEVKEDWIFDKKRSRPYFDIQSVTIMLPADQNTSTGLEIPIASFKYKDLDRLFRSDPKKYIWYNTVNSAQHKNLADAFDLRLFYGRITKYSNPMDRSFIDIYKGEKQGLIKSLQYEQELLELESSMWEY